MLDKTFDFAAVEPRLYQAWEDSGAFQPADEGEPFSIVIPPPNVTGSLHLGHALNATLQDVLTRFHRMRGRSVLWLPGTDHAGIATQMVVERQLAAEGNLDRRAMGRDAFVERVWRWKAESGGLITQQLRRLGASCDWSRERFTLDEGLSAAVRKVFVQLHREGLLYRDKRLVNWDPHFQTAISDLEVEQREVDGFYWHFAYPLEDGSGEIVVATTRPETMLGDTGVAVHPDDERYRHLVGRRVRLPIADRSIPVVADAYADPEKGSGAVKITPAHDFNDYQVGRRQNLDVINILDDRARLNDDVPAEFRGMDRFEARKAVVARMDELGLLRGIESTRHAVPHGDRSGAVIEPYLTDQWYVDAATLAQPAIAAVEDGRTVFEPRNWERTYFQWMRNIEPWCVSRQLWWGHRIPAWYDPEGFAHVAESEEEARAAALAMHGREVELRQDEDVLDTWFSSALWPFSTLGWPEATDDLRRFYPTDTLVTASDIIFFWVARMMMMGLHFPGDIPFERVFITALIRDEKGQKMSKSKGNVIDPLGLIEEFGADALRFTLTAMSSGGRDIKMGRGRVEGYRNFGTKLWNAARFCQMNGCALQPGFDPARVQQPLNRWIRGEAARTAAAVTAALNACAFDDAAEALYRFIWNTFCDWHLELAKPIFAGDDEAAKAETRAATAWALDQACLLLHPISPFITEELWGRLAESAGLQRETPLITAAWPDLPESFVDPEAASEIDWVIALVTEVRSLRSEMNVPPSARPVLTLVGADAPSRDRLARHNALLLSLARLGAAEAAPAAPAGSVPFVIGEAAGALAVAEFVDLSAERGRLNKEIAGHEAEAGKVHRKLNNPDFLARAKPEVVEENRARLAEAEAAMAKLRAALARLEALA
ncbi:MAG: valine--tRNA ligase [Proteobacteria bacterium]|nr:valine--tRNA ligase [Pseudomonadota bacterium]